MAILDTITMYMVANKLYSLQFESWISAVSSIIMISILVIPFFLNSVLLKITFTIVYLFIFLAVAWKYFLSSEEKIFISSKLNLNITK